jgi:outer membrane protein assembly factor BamB
LASNEQAYYGASADGNLAVKWETPIFDSLLYSRKLNGGMNAQVVGSDSLIAVPTFNERIYFLNPANGKTLDVLPTESAVGSSAALVGELIYFSDEAGGDRLMCFNVVNGKVVFQTKILDPTGPPIIDGDDIYLSSRIGKVYRLNRWRGEIVWTFDTGQHLYCSPTVDSGQVYVGSDHGEVICLDKTSGKKQWSFKCGGAIFARPVIGMHLYCPSGDGILYALDLTNGTLVWSFTTLGSIHTTPALAGTRLVFGSDDKMTYCLDAATGATLWTYETDGIIQSPPLASTSLFIVCNSAGSIYQFHHGGELLRTTKVKGSITAPPAIIGKRLFVVTKSRFLYCLGPTAN